MRPSVCSISKIAAVTSTFVTRFAPSPNGDLHLGHAMSAMTGFELARRQGGRFLVRIEDIDIERTGEQYVSRILDDLRWLGLRWEEPVLRQSSRFAAYRKAAADLLDRGLLYPCFATRGEIEAAVTVRPAGTDPDGAPLYPGIYRNLTARELHRRKTAGEPYCLRIDMDRALKVAASILDDQPLTFYETTDETATNPTTITTDPARWGDLVIVRKDTPASYHLAVVLDDAAQGITHVTRGRDLYPATDLHRLLQVLLGLPAPVYHHHRLILDPTGRKLSKSQRDTTLQTLRADGLTRADVRRLIGLLSAPA
jgi:glutamyl-Q tRNA(Asp) synthetase